MRWLKRHPRFHMLFTPTSSSWLNLVQRWFRELTDKSIPRGVFRSVAELIAAIDEYVEVHNDLGESGYKWKASAEDIIAKYHCAKAALDKIETA